MDDTIAKRCPLPDLVAKSNDLRDQI